MEPQLEPIPSRLVKLDRILAGRNLDICSKLVGREALLDSLVLLYEQCSRSPLKKDKHAIQFAKKFQTTVKELRRLRVDGADFEVQKVIGRGHFGEVRVVREKDSGDVYAMKVLRKSETLSQQNVAFFEEERDIMAFARSPWITRLQYAFQDRENLYLVMEFHQGGDLLALLERNGGSLSENATRFYFAEIALAIKALHSIGYAHRDIKPDNILIDLTGHVKLADFGSAAKLSSNNLVCSKMAVGTPEYVAPEVLASVNGNGSEVYGTDCDWWSLGILAYEMLYGKTPFANDRVVVTYSNIMNHDKILAFPSDVDVSDEARDVIKGLLCGKDARLGFDTLCSHSFFSLIDWEGIRDATPPFVPTVHGQYDTSNFDEFEPVPHQPQASDFRTPSSQFNTNELPFVGFTFTQSLGAFTDQSILREASKSVLEEELGRKLASAESREVSARSEAQMTKVKLEQVEQGLRNMQEEKENFDKEFVKVKTESVSWKRLVELERQERLTTERKALELLKDIKSKWKKAEEEKFETFLKENESLRGFLTVLETKYKEAKVAQLTLQEELKQSNSRVLTAETNSKNYKNRLRRSMDSSKGGVIELQRQMEEQGVNYVKEIDALQTELSQTKATLESAEDALKVTRITGHELQQCVENMDAKSKEAATRNNDELNKLRETADELRQQLVAIENLREVETENHQIVVFNLEREKMAEEAKSQMCAKLHELETVTAQMKTENDLLKDQIANLNQSNGEKTQTVEELKAVVDRLEEGLKKLDIVHEGSPRKTADILTPLQMDSKENANVPTSLVLEGRLARLETQLEKAREATVSERKQCRELRVDIVKKDRELSDLKLDLRIATREAKEAQDKLEKMKSETQPKLQEVTELAQKAMEFEKECKRLENEMNSGKKLWEIEKARLEEQVRVLGTSQSESQGLRQKADKTEGRIQEAEKHIKTLEERVQGMVERNQELKGELEKAQNEGTQCRRQKESLEVNLSCLRQVCSTMDGQLKDFETLVECHEAEENRLQKEIEVAKAQIKSLTESVQNANCETDSGKAKLEASEGRANELQQRMAAGDAVKDAEAAIILEERDYLKDLTARLTEELGAAETDVATAEVVAQKWQQKYCHLELEVTRLKEEMAQCITNLHSSRDTNKKLTGALQEAVVRCEQANERIVQLQDSKHALQATHSIEKVKLQETLGQHAKLIYFLQSQLNSSSKKKTLQDKLFGRRRKKAEYSLVITEQLTATPITKSIVSTLALSPGAQDCQMIQAAHSGLAVPSAERMHHNIPHRMQVTLAMQPSKCSACLGCIHFGRQMSRCQECGDVVHTRCSSGFHTTCGLPMGLMDHFRLSMKKKKSQSSSSPCWARRSNSLNEKKPHGWVKVPRTGKQGWENRYLKFEGETLYFYDKEDGKLIESLQLKAETECVVVHEAVGPTELPSTATSDLPYVFKLESTPDTTCWPSRCVYLMATTFPEKLSWVSALQKSIGVNGGLHSSDLNRSCDVLITSTAGLEMNCICQLDNDVMLLGAEEGLFIINILTEANLKLGNAVSGVGPVYQISVISSLGIVLLLEGKDRRLSFMQLENVKSFISDKEKKLEMKPIEDIIACHLFALSNHADEEPAFLFVACSEKIALLRWNNSLGNFCRRQETKTPEPCSCAVFTKRFLIFGVDKFYKLDLTTMVIKEFLDSTDTALAYVVYGALQLNSFPVAVLQVAPPTQQDEEFLLCFHEFGVFVDSHGRRTRKDDLKWTRLPLAFAFCHPYLFIIHFHSVEVGEVAQSHIHGLTRQTFVEMSGPRSLGNVNSSLDFTVSTSGAIYVATSRDSTAKLLALYGEKAMKKAPPAAAGILDRSDSVSSASEFSFTSSVFQALDSPDESAI